ncbi:MAG: glycosyl hydrolase, partial [Proteobacteria bacterium]|nr:glycosyl hydrolase [Pseudomonadota bacterium]
MAFLKREANGSGWKVVNRAITDKHIHAVIVEPISGAIIAGATHDSVYVSEDGGDTWDQRDNGIVEHDIYSLASARVNGGARIFVGTQPAHLYYSDDLGHNWTELEALRSVDMAAWTFPAPPHIAHTKHINFHPADPNTLFISIEQGGLVKSTDGGRSFTTIPGMDDDVHRTVINPLNPDRIYVTGGDGMYVTSDGGAAWEHWTTTDHEIGAYPDMLVLHPRNPDLVFVASAQYGPGAWRETHYAGTRISKSTDGGRTWETVRNGLPDRLQTAVEAMCLEDWGDSFSIFAATATGEIWCSEDGGENWSEIVTGLAPISKGDL